MQRKMTRKVIAASAALLTVATLAGCASDEAAAAEGASITVGTLSGQPHLFHPFWYEQFLPEGYEVDVVTFTSSPDIKNAIVSGAIDFGVTGIPAVVAGVAAGEDVVVIASAADGGTAIVGNPDIDGITDLVGRTVGFPQGSSQEILLRLTLAQAGVEFDSLNLVNLPFADMANALATGQIEAFASAELGPSIARLAGAVDIASPYETPVGRVNIGLATTRTLIEENPELVATIVAAHQATSEAMAADPQAWAQGVTDQFGIDFEVVYTATSNIWPRWSLEQAFQDQVVALATEMNALGHLASVPAAADIFDTQFVD